MDKYEQLKAFIQLEYDSRRVSSGDEWDRGIEYQLEAILEKIAEIEKGISVSG